MKHPIDPNILEQLSAYVDGALSAADAAIVERLVESDPAIAAEFEALSRIDDLSRTAFAGMLADPVPVALTRTIDRALFTDTTLVPQPAANLTNAPTWRALAAAFALLLIGGTAGAYLTHLAAPGQRSSAMSWLDQVAEYHQVYATQKRHLVEVPASETEHLQSWLTSVTGVAFSVPDLSTNGLTFQGGRLLVANGKPVAQLMYTDPAGRVVAICFLAGGDSNLGAGHTTPKLQLADGLDMVWWTSKDASYVVVGPTSGIDLQSVAKAASTLL